MAAAAAGALAQAPAQRSGDEIVVLGRWDNPFGYSVSASQGVVGAAELERGRACAPARCSRTVPGLIVTQHSGTGKANQMFLRGFNLDHGTDFATWVDGMPVNLPTHGHGQGYTDLNFLIPELVERLEYRKGAYYAEVADFSSAGAADLRPSTRCPQGIVKAGRRRVRLLRALAADSVERRRRQLLYGVQAHRYDGPWEDIDEDVERNNVLLRYSREGPTAAAGTSRSWATTREWNSRGPDPAARRGERPDLARSARSTPTLGGETSRYSLSGGWNARARAPAGRA